MAVINKSGDYERNIGWPLWTKSRVAFMIKGGRYKRTVAVMKIIAMFEIYICLPLPLCKQYKSGRYKHSRLFWQGSHCDQVLIFS